MKKITGLMIGVLFAGIANAQIDTLPPVRPNTMDTISGKWPKDTAVNKTDSSNLQQWKKQDTVADTNMMDKTVTPGADKKVNHSLDKMSNQPDSAKIDNPVTDRVLMKEGEMVLIKKGEQTKMREEVRLPSGTVITPDGIVKKKDGTSVQLKNGQYIELKPVPVKKESSAVKKVPVKKSRGKQ
jgi:hypothetical protein